MRGYRVRMRNEVKGENCSWEAPTIGLSRKEAAGVEDGWEWEQQDLGLVGCGR